MTVQYSLVKYGNEFEKDSMFLKSLYHRWILRSSQTPLKRNFLLDDPLAESVLRALTPEESVAELKGLLTKDLEQCQIFIPTPETFLREKPNFSIGVATNLKTFASMIHLDIGIYLLYKGQLTEAIEHFVEQKLPLENFPYLKITKEKLDGYLKALGLLIPTSNHLNDFDLGECKMVKIGKLVRKGSYGKLKRMLNLDLVIEDNVHKALESEFIDQDEGEEWQCDNQSKIYLNYNLVMIIIMASFWCGFLYFHF